MQYKPKSIEHTNFENRIVKDSKIIRNSRTTSKYHKIDLKIYTCHSCNMVEVETASPRHNKILIY